MVDERSNVDVAFWQDAGEPSITCSDMSCHACIDVFMYVCMHACMHACKYVCMYVCMYVCAKKCMVSLHLA